MSTLTNIDVTQRPPRVALDYKKTTVFNHQYRSNNDYLNSIEFANIIYIYVYLFRKIKLSEYINDVFQLL